MTIITIDTTPLSEFFRRFFEALGTKGLILIILCFFIYLTADMLQEERTFRRRFKELRRNTKKVNFYHKKLKGAKTLKDLRRLEEWRKKNEDAFYY